MEIEKIMYIEIAMCSVKLRRIVYGLLAKLMQNIFLSILAVLQPLEIDRKPNICVIVRCATCSERMKIQETTVVRKIVQIL